MFLSAHICIFQWFIHMCIFIIASSKLGVSFINPNSVTKTENVLNDLKFLIVELITQRIDDIKCLSVLNDEEHQDVFDEVFFQHLDSLPFYKILVNTSEDILSPSLAVPDTIKQAQTVGCQLFFVFLTDGSQVVRLLRHMDRRRQLTSQAKLVVLYDRELFRADVNTLWRRFVNVLFVRRYRGDRFELSTVPYPAPVRGAGVLLPWRLEIWRRGRAVAPATGRNVFGDKTADLRGREIPVVLFEHFPSVVMETGQSSNDSTSRALGGVEIQILNIIASAMNFVPQFITLPKGASEKWGRPQNGSYNGLIGEVIEGRADVALGSFYYTPLHLQLLDLSAPYDTQCLTFVTPESLTDISWKTLVRPFKPVLWAAILVALTLGGSVFYGLARFHQWLSSRSEEHRHVEGAVRSTGLFVFGEIQNSVLYSFGMQLLVSLPSVPQGWSLRVLTGWWWVYCLLVAVAYRSSMTAILAHPAQKVVINTVEQLAAAPWVGAGGWGEQNKHFFLTSLDPAGQQLGERFQVLHDTADVIIKRVAEGKFAFYENIYFLSNIVGLFQDEDHNDTMGESPLHIMETCVVHLPVSLALQKNSPLKPHFDRVIRRVIEVGLVDKWLRDFLAETRAKEQRRKKTETKALMNLRKLYGALVILGVGYVLGIVALLGEILYWKYVVQRNPHFDKFRLNLYYNHHKKKQVAWSVHPTLIATCDNKAKKMRLNNIGEKQELKHLFVKTSQKQTIT